MVLLEHTKGMMQLHDISDKPLLWESTLGQLLAVQIKNIIPSALLLDALQTALTLHQWKRSAKNVDCITLGNFSDVFALVKLPFTLAFSFLC